MQLKTTTAWIHQLTLVTHLYCSLQNKWNLKKQKKQGVVESKRRDGAQRWEENIGTNWCIYIIDVRPFCSSSCHYQLSFAPLFCFAAALLSSLCFQTILISYIRKQLIGDSLEKICNSANIIDRNFASKKVHCTLRPKFKNIDWCANEQGYKSAYKAKVERKLWTGKICILYICIFICIFQTK